MKSVLLITGILLVSLLTGCALKTASTQNAKQSNEAPAKSSAAATPNGTLSPKSSGERGTPAEAKAMLQSAVLHYNEVGRKQALADFNSRKPAFYDRDLYVVCIAPDRTIAANGAFSQYVGASVDVWKDADGKPLGQAIFDTGNRGEDSIHYRMINPLSGKFEPKVLFVKKVGDDVCGVGAYNPQ